MGIKGRTFKMVCIFSFVFFIKMLKVKAIHTEKVAVIQAIERLFCKAIKNWELSSVFFHNDKVKEL